MTEETKDTKSFFSGIFQTEETEKYQLIKTFFDEENIDLKTDLTNAEIYGITGIEFFNDYIKENWGIDLNLRKITNSIKTKKVSLNRKGREEAFRALSEEKESEESKSKLRRILGL